VLAVHQLFLPSGFYSELSKTSCCLGELAARCREKKAVAAAFMPEQGKLIVAPIGATTGT
jgi:hypothetical protein